MTINTLRYFVAVAELGSYSKVASEMFVSQPTISRSIMNFENEIGVTLLHRNGKVITKTDAGNLVYLHAKKILNELDQMDSDIREFMTKRDCSLRIAYHHFDALLADILLQTLQSMAYKYPEVTISITDFGDTGALEQNLIEKFDIAFAPELYVMEMKGVMYEPMYKDPLIVVVSTDNPLAERGTLTCADVVESEIVLAHTKDGELAHKRIIAAFEKNGTPIKRLRYVPSHDHIFLEIMTGTGAGLMAASILEGQGYKTSNTLHGIPIENCEMNFDVALAWREDNPNTAKDLFIEEIKSRYTEIFGAPRAK